VRPATLFGLYKLSRSAVDEAEHVRVPSLTMIGGKEDLLREDCIRRLHARLAGDKQWARFKNGPHLLLHWKNRDKVLSRVFAWIDGQLTRGAYNAGPANP
jgi:esterase/lipase